jgi:2-dehydropantoate 2-reductase
MLNITVIGGGSVGLAVSATFAQAGANVTLLARAASVDRLAGEPVTITGKLGDHSVAPGVLTLAGADSPPPTARDCDVLMVTTKAHDLAAALRPFAEATSPRPRAVLLFQNGLGSAEVARGVLGPSVPVFSAAMYVGMQRHGLCGVAVNAASSPVMVGSLLGDDIAALGSTLEAAARGFLQFVHAPDIRDVVLTKLLFNSCMNPTGALIGRTYGELLDNAHSRALITRLAQETLETYAAAFDFRPAPDGPTYVDQTLFPIVFPRSAPHRSSMAQDLEAGRRTEIDVLNGAILRLGTAHGVATPCHATIVDLVRAREPAE